MGADLDSNKFDSQQVVTLSDSPRGFFAHIQGLPIDVEDSHE